ncbi:MAG: terminase large subunit domain-containing protein, partial [Candidatus Thorarchaeota archaeon]
MKIRKRKVSREMLFLEIWVVVTLLSMALGQYVASLVIDLRPHQIEWLRFIIDSPASLLLAPRGHGKSTIMYCFVVWSVCMDPGIRILLAAHKEELANTRAREIQRALERKDIQEKFNIQPGKPWRVDYFFFKEKRHPVVQTVAKQAGMTGGRYDIVVFDDLLTVENSRTEKRRAQLQEWINSEVVPALDPSPKRKEIVVGTRKNVEDWYSEILEMPDFKHMVYRLFEMSDGKKIYLWPERFDEEEELRLRTRMQPDQFAREYMNSPIAGEGLKFKRSWIEPYYYTSWKAE